MNVIKESEHTKVVVLDEPGEGGACHEYEIKAKDPVDSDILAGKIQFQKGPIQDGINGCTIEDLLAVCIHRIEGFQNGDFNCEENAHALYHVKNAKQWLEDRTKDRKERGVEGTNQK
jgi:hypothetical protein